MLSQVASWRYGAPTLSPVFSYLLKVLFLCFLEKRKRNKPSHNYLIQPLMITSVHKLLVLVLDKVIMLCSPISCSSLCFPNYLAQECLITQLQMALCSSFRLFIPVCTTDYYLISLLYFKGCYVTM